MRIKRFLKRALITAVLILAALPAWSKVVYHGKVVRQLPMEPGEAAGLALSKSSNGSKNPATAPGHFWPHPTGVRPMLALLVDFSDAPADFPPSAIDSLLNVAGYKRFGNHGSVRDFYLDATRGNIDIHYDAKGYYRAKHPKSYYENQADYAGGDELAEEVIRSFDAQVDFAAYGTPGEGSLNSIAILYAGAEKENGLWGVTTTLDFSLDGKKIGRTYWAAIGKSEMSIATYCHEMGHMLFNWPDLYNVPKDGLGAHCLMASYADDYDPVPPDEALRADQGWIEVQDLVADSRGIYPAPANPDKVFRFLNPARSDEGFFAVNRMHTGRYRSLGGQGLLLFHFDMAWNETDDSAKAAVMLVPDLGRIKPPVDWFEPGWYFYRGNMAEFSSSTQAGENAWHDGKASGIRLYDISAPSDTMSFTMGEAVSSLRGPLMATGTENPIAGRPLYDVRGDRIGQDSAMSLRSPAFSGPRSR